MIFGCPIGFCLKTNGASVKNPTRTNVCTAYRGVNAAYQAYLNAIAPPPPPPTNPPNPPPPLTVAQQRGLSEIFGKSIRVAFHDAAEYSQLETDSSGPDGCLSSSVNNAGLVEPSSLVNTVLEPIWQEYCDLISHADFWALIGKLAVEKADPTRTVSIPYQYGRTDSSTCTDLNRLPDPQKGLGEISAFFVTRLGFSLSEAGLHAILT